MVFKRKAASTLVKHATEDPGEVQKQAKLGKVEVVVMKTRAAAASSKEDVDEPMEDDDREEDEKSQDVSQEELEKQNIAQRTKELKAKPVNEIKHLVGTLDLQTGNKQDMIQAILTYEAKARAGVRAHEAKIRAVVLAKKEELETLSISELAKLCNAIGAKGIMSKQSRVQCLLKQWQEDDGVDKALQKSAFDARTGELEVMERSSLKSICEQADIDPFIAEVMVDRIVKKEHEMGHFSRPIPIDDKPKITGAKEENVDIVTALLNNEKNRKKEEELKKQREEEIANKIKKLQAMSLQDLKSELSKKGTDPTGKKDEMVKALFEMHSQEEKVIARKAEFKSMGMQAVKELCANNGLKTGSMEEMVTVLLAQEAKLREDIHSYDSKFADVLAEKKDELNSKTSNELKELCVSQGLRLGNTKEERLEHLLQDANKDGQIDQLVARAMRKIRKQALLTTEKKKLVQMCEKLDADPLVKEVMIERILEHEKEFGQVIMAPLAKKARTSQK